MAHRQSAERISGLLPPSDDDPFATQFSQPRRGALLLYPAVDPDSGSLTELAANGKIDPSKVVMSFSLLPAADPTARNKPLLRFRTIDSSRGGDAIVEAR